MPLDHPSSVEESGKEDPLGFHWQEAFFLVRGRGPADADRQDRLFSLIFLGNGPDNSWTEADWAIYKPKRKALWSGQESWPVADSREGYERFQFHLKRLAGYYGKNRQGRTRFARAAGLIWGGIDYEGSVFMALVRASIGRHHLQLHEGAASWQAYLLDDLNPAHHWVAAFLTGFHYGTFIGAAINTIRDVAQYVTGQGGHRGDIYLGNLAAKHGHLLSHDLAEEPDPYASLLARMRQDMFVHDSLDDEI